MFIAWRSELLSSIRSGDVHLATNSELMVVLGYLTEAIELQIQQLRSGEHATSASSLLQKQKTFEKAEAEFVAAQAKWDEEKQQLHSQIWDTLQQLATHKAEIQKTISFTQAYCNEKHRAIEEAGDTMLEEIIADEQ